ncbi:MAG: PKD domain-containing protein [Brumimicrobium sp.]
MKKILFTTVFTSVFMLTLNAQQVENGSFEDGTYASTGGASDPQDWGTFNFDNFGFPATTTLSTTDPFHSSTSVRLETINGGYSAINASIDDTIGGAILTGDPLATQDIAKPHTTKLQSISFHYKTNLVNNDTSMFLAQFTRYDTGLDSTIVIGGATLEIGDNESAWTEVNLPIQYFSNDTPDSLLVIAQSSYGSWPVYFGNKEPEPGTVFELDAIVYCDTFAIDFDTTIVERTVDLTAMTSATGNGGAGTVSWDFGDGNTSTDMNPSHEYATNGDYTISLTVVDSCGNDSTYTEDVTIDSDLAVGVQTNPANLSIYPNPAKEKVNVKFALKEEKDVNISILDLTGRVVSEEYNKFTSSDNVTINTSKFNPGNYMVVISTKDGFKQVERLVIQ